MKYTRLNHLSYWTMALILSSSLYTTACTEDITISQLDESNYTISNEQLGYVCDETGNGYLPKSNSIQKVIPLSI